MVACVSSANSGDNPLRRAAHAVSAELGLLPGVRDVRVDLAAGTATVTSAQPLAVDAVRDAVDEAGYELADQP